MVLNGIKTEVGLLMIGWNDASQTSKTYFASDYLFNY